MSLSCSLRSDYLTRLLVAMYNCTYLVADHIPIDSTTNSKNHNLFILVDDVLPDLVLRCVEDNIYHETACIVPESQSSIFLNA